MPRFFSLFFLLSIFSVQAQQITLARKPALSPDAKSIAFSFQGDIWKLKLEDGIPQRLTIHESYESAPVFSPNRKEIAFSSNRYGNYDVFTTSVDGGIPKRLTYHSANDMVTDWTKEETLLFDTRRNFQQVEWDGEVYSIAQNGGTPQRLLNAVGEMAVASPDGRKIAFVRGACRISREAYTGPADMDIWVYDVTDQSYTLITHNDANDYLPKWDEKGRLYFLSSLNGKYNICRYTEGAEGTPLEFLTMYNDEGIRHYDVKKGTLVFERGVNLYIQEDGNHPYKIDLNIHADYRFDPQERKTFSGDVNEYMISPNGKFVAMQIHGEIFVKELDKEKKRSVNLSEHAYRDQDLAWLNDSSVLFTSDRDGQYDIYLATSTDKDKPDLFESLKHKVTRITQTAEDESNLLMSPDGKQIAFIKGRGDLVVADINEKAGMSNQRVLSSGWNTPSQLAWSPDSRYLAYSQRDLNFNSEVYIHAVDGKSEAVNVSMHPRGDYSPTWSADGSKLGFVSSRNNDDNDVWFVWLRKEDWLKTKEDREEGYYFNDPKPTPNKNPEPKEEEGTEAEEESKSKKKKKDEEVEPIIIDFENIYDRLQQVTSMPGNEGSVVISKDGETFYFTAGSPTAKGSDLYKIKFDGSEIEQLTKGGQRPGGLEPDPNGDDLYFIKRGTLNKVSVKNGKTTAYPHSAKMLIDHNKEREQVFEEAWRVLEDNFYDPDFHGQDWVALKAKYKPWALAASTSQDFRYIFNLMLGQLNASHLGLYGGDPEKTQRQGTGMLGLEVVSVKEGVKVTHVVPNAPADRERSHFKENDIILAVDGISISSEVNFYELMADQTNNRILVTVRGEDGEKRELAIRPISSIREQLYEEWVKQRQELTEKYSNGRLGYIHIQGMNIASFERFERELMASGMGKEGIVIDVRFNGGGWTTDYLMAVLNVKQHAYTIPRGAAKSLNEHTQFSDFYPYSERLPLSSWTKPSIAMCNESSYSNAEIFSHAYKTLGIGTLVGMPTFGAVISTGGAGLLDGSFVRMPFRAWYVKSTGENMENGPAVPDVLVENAPDDKAKNEDTQLQKAVEVLLKQIDEGAE